MRHQTELISFWRNVLVAPTLSQRYPFQYKTNVRCSLTHCKVPSIPRRTAVLRPKASLRRRIRHKTPCPQAPWRQSHPSSSASRKASVPASDTSTHPLCISCTSGIDAGTSPTAAWRILTRDYGTICTSRDTPSQKTWCVSRVRHEWPSSSYRA